MITRITVENFKSYRQAELPLTPLTLLIGANASGKTNLIEAIRFLSLLAEGQHLDDLLASLRRSETVVRGDVHRLTHAEEDRFSVGCDLDDSAVGPWTSLGVSVFAVGGRLRIAEEGVRSSDGDTLYHTVADPDGASFFTGEGALEVMYQDPPTDTAGRLETSASRAVFSHLSLPLTPKRYMGHSLPRVLEAYRSRIRGIQFVNPIPARMRGASDVLDRVLAEDGQNLASVLLALDEDSRTGEVLDFVRDVPEEEVTLIDFAQWPSGEVTFQLEENFGGQHAMQPATVLSDGTLRVLAIAAAVLSVPEGSLVVMEEVDNGVHPSRVSQLLRNIRRVATERKLTVLVTTHNPALLDTLPDEAVPDVVACYRDPEEGDSRLVRLAELTEYPELVARGPLGRLMTQGILERTLKHRQSEEERRAEAIRQTEEFLSRMGHGS